MMDRGLCLIGLVMANIGKRRYARTTANRRPERASLVRRPCGRIWSSSKSISSLYLRGKTWYRCRLDGDIRIRWDSLCYRRLYDR